MPKGLKITIAVVLIVVGLASMGMAWLRDSSRRPEYCAQCHAVMEPYYTSWESSDYLANEHAEAAIPCQSCHSRTMSDSLGEIVTYARGEYETPLEEQEYSKEWCFQCHEHGSYEELIQRTEELELNPHDSHYGEMECNICHKVHRASEDYCAQCHDPMATGTGWITATQPITQVLEWWDPDMDCAYCHVMASYTESLQDATLLANVHAQEGLVCLDCHEQAVLEQVHEEAKPGAPRLKERTFPMESCFDCHVPNEHTSYEEVIERTKDYTVDDEEINPHDPHAGVEGSEQEQFECYYCHKMHKESPGINGCYSCHHAGTFENCSVCH